VHRAWARPQRTAMSMTSTISRPHLCTVLSWRACARNTLLGFADVSLPSGIVIRGLAIHQKGERRWVGLPARPYETDSGSTSWAPVVEIPDRETRKRFEGLVLAAVDKHLGAR
jgi:hypothetical protein